MTNTPTLPPFHAPEFALGQRITTLANQPGRVIGRGEPTAMESGDWEYCIRLDDGREFLVLGDILLAAA